MLNNIASLNTLRDIENSISRRSAPKVIKLGKHRDTATKNKGSLFRNYIHNTEQEQSRHSRMQDHCGRP